MHVRRMVACLAVAVAMLAVPTATQAAAPLSEGERDGWIVVLAPGTSSSARPTTHAQGHDLAVDRVFSHAVRGYSAQLTRGEVAKLRRDPAVLAVEPDVRVWALAQSVPTGLDRVTLPDTPGLTPSATTVDGVDDRVDADIAVIDTGVGPHPDLNVVMRTNCVTSTCADGVGNDDNGHGTHVGGSAAALDNGFGVVGVAPGARLWSVKVLNAFGTGTMSAVVAGIDWVTARSDTIDVANLSIGCNCVSLAADNALARAKAAGVTVVVAAGNSSEDTSPYSIGNSPHVITTSALADFNGVSGGGGGPTCRPDVDDTLADFSNFGAVVDLAAPGVCIRSTYLGAGYADLSGTSMASPHVAGAAALLASDPSYAGNPTAIQARLIADGNPGWVDDSGDGVKEPLLDVTGLTPVTLPGSAPVTLSLDDAWVAEGSPTQLRVRLSRPLAGGEVVTTTLTSANGTAQAGADYSALPATVVQLVGGQAEMTVPLSSLTDARPEGHETFTVSATKVVGAVLADSSSTVTIYDGGGPLDLSVTDTTVLEGAGPASVVISLDAPVPAGHQVTVTAKTANSSATSGSDYTALPSQTLTFSPGQQTKTVTTTVFDDGLSEGNESFSLVLSSPSGARLVDGTGSFLILDDEGPIGVSVGNAWIPEGDAGTSSMAFAVSLSAPPGAGQSVTATVKTSNSSAVSGSDYVAVPSTTLTFAAGVTTRTVVVTVLGNTVPEPNEALKLTITKSTGAVATDSAGYGTIANDDGGTPAAPPRWLTIGDGWTSEVAGGLSGLVTLSLSSPPLPGETVQATVTSVSGSAAAGTDFVALPPTTVTFAEGETERTVAVSALDDSLAEPTEAFTLQVSSAVGATAIDTVGTVNVVSDEAPISGTVDDPWVIEGDSGQQVAVVTIRLSAAPSTGQSVSLKAATAASTASAGSDYVTVPATTLTFTAGQTVRTFAVTVNGDVRPEGTETLLVNLTSPSGLSVADSQGTITLVGEEAPVTASLVDTEVAEGQAGSGSGALTVRLSEAPQAGQTLTLKVGTTTGGSATATVDYLTRALAVVTFAAGETSKTLPVTVLGDLSAEQHETVRLTASTPTGGLVLADSSANLTISNDD